MLSPHLDPNLVLIYFIFFCGLSYLKAAVRPFPICQPLNFGSTSSDLDGNFLGGSYFNFL